MCAVGGAVRLRVPGSRVFDQLSQQGTQPPPGLHRQATSADHGEDGVNLRAFCAEQLCVVWCRNHCPADLAPGTLRRCYEPGGTSANPRLHLDEAP